MSAKGVRSQTTPWAVAYSVKAASAGAQHDVAPGGAILNGEPPRVHAPQVQQIEHVLQHDRVIHGAALEVPAVRQDLLLELAPHQRQPLDAPGRGLARQGAGAGEAR